MALLKTVMWLTLLRHRYVGSICPTSEENKGLGFSQATHSVFLSLQESPYEGVGLCPALQPHQLPVLLQATGSKPVHTGLWAALL